MTGLDPVNIQAALNTITTTEGDMLDRGEDDWIAKTFSERLADQLLTGIN